jgi:hypothetical protein
VLRLTATREGLDDDHAATAAWTGQRQRPRFFVVIGLGGLEIARASRHGQQLTDPFDIAGAGAMSEQTVVADAMEAARQNMDQEAADELVGGERHDLPSLTTFGAVVLPLEGDAIVIERDEAAVGDGNAVDVTGTRFAFEAPMTIREHSTRRKRNHDVGSSKFSFWFMVVS